MPPMRTCSLLPLQCFITTIAVWRQDYQLIVYVYCLLIRIRVPIHGPPGRLDGHDARYHTTDHVSEDMAPNLFSLQLEAVLPKLRLNTEMFVLQLLHQPLHIYKIYKILHIKTLKKLRHVSVLRPSSGSYNFLAKVTLEIVTY